MVVTGEYAKDTTVGWTKDSVTRKLGDVWEDNDHKYEQKEGYILKTSKNSDAYQEIRDYVKETTSCKNPDCKRVKMNDVDKKLIKRTSYCVDCLVEREHKIRVAGLWVDYQNHQMWTRTIVNGKIRLDQLRQALVELKQTYEYPNEDGSMEKWTMPNSVDEVKNDINDMIERGTKEIEELDEKRLEAFNKIKEKGYESYL